MTDSIKAANLGRCFPLWTVTRAAWHKALKPEVLGVSAIMHYWVFGHSVAHASLHGTFMAKLRIFTVRACADAKWVVKCDQIQGTQSPTSSGPLTPLPRSIRPWRSDDDSPARKAPRAVSPVVPEVLTRTVPSMIVS